MERVVFSCMESVRVAKTLEDIRGVEGVVEDLNVVEVYVDELKVGLEEIYERIFDGIGHFSDGKGVIYFTGVGQFNELKRVKELCTRVPEVDLRLMAV